MNRDPFLRLALIAACTAYGIGLVAVAGWFGVAVAAGALIFGAVAAALLTLELRTAPAVEPVEDLRQRRRQPAEGTRGFERIE